MREKLERFKSKCVELKSFVDTLSRYYFIDKKDLEGIEMSLFVNCIDNPALFQAVTAIREDSDYMQWFVIVRLNSATEEYETIWRLCITHKFDEDSLPYNNILISKKAELKELQNHFKVEH